MGVTPDFGVVGVTKYMDPPMSRPRGPSLPPFAGFARKMGDRGRDTGLWSRGRDATKLCRYMHFHTLLMNMVERGRDASRPRIPV